MERLRITVIGSTGQLGSDLLPALTHHEVHPLGHGDLDITEPSQVRATLEGIRPGLVINLAAFHRVDDCEDAPEKAFEVNALGVYHLARTCRDLDAVLLHVSTDYVFDGKKGSAYVESDVPHPLNVYGTSKLSGEHLIEQVLDRFYIVRTSGLYGVAGSSGKGGNFVELMLRLAREGKPIRVVDDQVLTPTYTRDLARMLAELITHDHYGLYHITSTGACSWYNFAGRIFELADLHPDLSPTTSASIGSKAARPAYSVLDSEVLPSAGLRPLRPWDEALAAYLEERQSTNQK